MHPEEIAHIRYIFFATEMALYQIVFIYGDSSCSLCYLFYTMKERKYITSNMLIKTSSYRTCKDVSFLKMYAVLFEKMFNLPIFFQIFHFSVVNPETSLS